MKTLLLLLVVGCGAPITSVQKPAPVAMVASPVPSGPPMAVASARPERCSLRLTAQRVMVDGDLMSIDDAVAICSQRAAVLVELADDADQAVWTQLDSALEAAKVPVMHRGPRGHDVELKAAPLDKQPLLF